MLLLEGHAVNLPRPKNHFSTDLKIPREHRIPFFSKSSIEYFGKYNIWDDRETEMMASRWKLFTFHAKILSKKVNKTGAISHCFDTLTMQCSDIDDELNINSFCSYCIATCHDMSRFVTRATCHAHFFFDFLFCLNSSRHVANILSQAIHTSTTKTTLTITVRCLWRVVLCLTILSFYFSRTRIRNSISYHSFRTYIREEPGKFPKHRKIINIISTKKTPQKNKLIITLRWLWLLKTFIHWFSCFVYHFNRNYLDYHFYWLNKFLKGLFY